MELKELTKIIENFLEEHKDTEKYKSERNSLWCTLQLIESTKEVKMEKEDFEEEEDEEESDETEELEETDIESETEE